MMFYSKAAWVEGSMRWPFAEVGIIVLGALFCLALIQLTYWLFL
jgi:hypothetical protein